MCTEKESKEFEEKGEKKMAVSKATIPCLMGELGNKVMKEIEATKPNIKLIKDSRGILSELLKKRANRTKW